MSSRVTIKALSFGLVAQAAIGIEAIKLEMEKVDKLNVPYEVILRASRLKPNRFDNLPGKPYFVGTKFSADGKKLLHAAIQGVIDTTDKLKKQQLELAVSTAETGLKEKAQTELENFRGSAPIEEIKTSLVGVLNTETGNIRLGVSEARDQPKLKTRNLDLRHYGQFLDNEGVQKDVDLRGLRLPKDYLYEKDKEYWCEMFWAHSSAFAREFGNNCNDWWTTDQTSRKGITAHLQLVLRELKKVPLGDKPVRTEPDANSMLTFKEVMPFMGFTIDISSKGGFKLEIVLDGKSASTHVVQYKEKLGQEARGSVKHLPDAALLMHPWISIQLAKALQGLLSDKSYERLLNLDSFKRSPARTQ
jgi:hypothetical protein